jgi:hypothetical protein
MNDSEFAELWLDTHAEGGTIETMVANYRTAVPESNAKDQSLKTALSTRATKIRSGFIALGKTEEEAETLFPKFKRHTKSAEKLTTALEHIMAIAAKNQETAAAVDAKSDIADEAAE